eukprot:TRINITY_DN22833_c0_g1_i1.p3 TRINITY_DN22833_c0_g1~~TRINITY_DN22833_c0_g1_i1.p3  ORF type:complete len:122 (-),score=3.52 TRINITY_DN22833_c0_g1_i1:83-448(-)
MYMKQLSKIVAITQAQHLQYVFSQTQFMFNMYDMVHTGVTRLTKIIQLFCNKMLRFPIKFICCCGVPAFSLDPALVVCLLVGMFDTVLQFCYQKDFELIGQDCDRCNSIFSSFRKTLLELR